MEDKKEINQENSLHVQLVKGDFLPEKAIEIMIALLDQKINYHKIEGIQLWEKDHKNDQEPINNRIKELEKEKKKAINFLSKMKSSEKKIQINGMLSMRLAD